MNTPNGMREFSLELAQQGHPICTRVGTPAEFITLVENVLPHHKVVVKIRDEVYTYNVSGQIATENINWELFLAPIGYVEGLPVFSGDIICNAGGKEFTAGVIDHAEECMHWTSCKWPSKAPIVKTRMSGVELDSIWVNAPMEASPEDACVLVANKAIERAILDGDVVPTSEIVELMCKAYDMRYQTHDFSFKQNAEFVLKQYLEGLK